MKSILNGINKKDANLLLQALKDYANAYYIYKDGTEYNPYIDSDSLNDKIHKLTIGLAKKINLIEED